MASEQEFGIVGLGKMGGSIALQARDKGMKVAGFDISGMPEELAAAGVVEVKEMKGFVAELHAPRVVFAYVPAGAIVDSVLDDLADALEDDDILVDGGNSYWGDSMRRHARYRERGLHFVDVGTSGGISGARNGACFMAGGEHEPVARVEPILKALAVAGGYVHAGPPGLGHFVKLVHNGIEFGMLQAIGEGVSLMERHPGVSDIADVLHCWTNGSVIRSWLVELMEEAYRHEGGIEDVPAFVEDTGEVNWLVEDAMHMEVSVPVIAQSVMQLFASRDDRGHSARAIAMMRHGFGGHPYGPHEGIAKGRRGSRVGPFQGPDSA